MALPSWVYNQSSLPPWMRQPPPPTSAPRRMPQAIPPSGGRTNIPAASASRQWLPRTPNTGYTPPFGQPVVSPMQGQNTNTGMQQTNTGMAGMGVPQPQAPQIPMSSFEQLPDPQYVEPQFEDDSSLFAGLGGPNPLSGQYSQLMQQMQQLMNQPGSKFTPFTPEKQEYSQTPELTNAIAMIKQLAESGGYSEGDKSELRARGVSPIRSVYANAQSGLDRSKSLQGGYSPGHTAATSKLARELSDRIAGQTSNVNADIADKVAQGKMAMAPQLGNITSRVNDAINDISGRNVSSGNEAGMFNTKMGFDVDQANKGNQNQIMGMIQNLFGTGADIAGRDADRNVNIAGLKQKGVSDRNQLKSSSADSRNKFNLSNRDSNQNMQQFMQKLGLDTNIANRQGGMQEKELSQNMQQFMQKMGLDTRNANSRDKFDWAQLEQQGGLGLIQAMMQMMNRGN